MSAEFDIFAAVGLNGTLVEANIHTLDTLMWIFKLQQVSYAFSPATVQMPNLALIGTKRITVFGTSNIRAISPNLWNS